jgi:hypothetical protein
MKPHRAGQQILFSTAPLSVNTSDSTASSVYFIEDGMLMVQHNKQVEALIAIDQLP